MKLLKIKFIISSLVITVVGLSLLSNVVFGQIANIPIREETNITSVGGLVDVIRGVVRWVYIVFFILAVLFILFAAFSYLTAGGDPEKVGKAKNQLIYAAVAIAVALLSVGFEQIILQFLQEPVAGQ